MYTHGSAWYVCHRCATHVLGPQWTHVSMYGQGFRLGITVVYMSEERYLSEETHTEKLF